MQKVEVRRKKEIKRRKWADTHTAHPHTEKVGG